jgi:hypothetical protein
MVTQRVSECRRAGSVMFQALGGDSMMMLLLMLLLL